MILKVLESCSLLANNFLSASTEGSRVRQLLFLGTLTTLLACVSPATASIELPEWCHMGECSIQTLESKELLRSSGLGDLYLSTFSTVQYPAPDSAASFRQRFVDYHGSELVEDSSESYIFCSKSMPSVLFVTDDKEHILNRLVLTGNRPASYMWHSHVNYLATCHNIAGPDYFSTDVANMLIQEGYSFGSSVRSVDEQMRVANILEIMNPDAVEYGP